MQALLTVIVTWLSANFAMPAIYEHPEVQFAHAARMLEVRLSRVPSGGPDHLTAGPGQAGSGHYLQAVYDDVSRTIYLPDDWTGTTPREVSVLVHELVHHLQNAAELRYDCAEAREKPAYQAQQRWLELFGMSLADEFQLDAMTILVRTNCLH